MDIDLKHQVVVSEQHNIIWGLGYRRILDDLQGKNHISFSPERRLVHRYNAFFQDEIILSPDKFSLIIGSQLEHNDFTGF